MIGRRFSRLVVQANDCFNSNRVVCLCDCGGLATVWKSSLYSGKTRSCGCLQRENTAKANTERVKHGLGNSPEFAVWRSMIQRCTDLNCHSYSYYDGRGIKVCDRWLSCVENFVADMGFRAVGTQLDRINNDGDYEPLNCRWVSRLENQMNRRNTVKLTCNGITLSAQEWSKKTGIKLATIYARKRAGWGDDRIIQGRDGNV